VGDDRPDIVAADLHHPVHALKIGRGPDRFVEAHLAQVADHLTDQLLSRTGPAIQRCLGKKSEPNFKKALEEQSLDNKAVSAPVFHYHGLEDELVPLSQDVNLHYDWCTLGVTDDFQLYSGEHLFTDAMGAPNARKWIEERVAGKTAPSTCGQHKAGATLPATARLTPEVGDLIVKLNEWSLTGKVTEAKSGISEEIPSGATISSTADATKKTLVATLKIPPINQTMVVWASRSRSRAR
jgi:hypothetical protein